MSVDPVARTTGRELHNLAIPTRDGVVLAANVYLPAGDGPWPTVVTYMPYVKDLWIGPLLDGYLRYFADHGYASALVDFRGTGASGGMKAAAFEDRENEDVYDLVESLAAQEWCDGSVGMWGWSYGGISALRAAAAAPPHLRAIIAIEGSTDPYLYEVMRYGAEGMAMICGEWSSQMLALNAVPPLAGAPDGNDEQVWREHLEGLRPWHFDWPLHPHYDEYWSKRAVDASSISVPAFFITSWRDATLAGPWNDFGLVTGPRRMIAGPWQHGIPDGAPRHPINSLREMGEWWDRWLGSGPSIDADEPPVSVFVQGADSWEAHEVWPPETEHVTFYPSDRRELIDATPDRSVIEVPFDGTVGAEGGLGTQHAAGDQTPDDERSVCFDTAPLEQDLEIAGVILVKLDVLDPATAGDIAVRLAAVDESGRSTLVTKGYRRVSNPPPYRSGNEHASDDIELELNPTRFRVARGQRLRLALAAADFPEIWPSHDRTGYRLQSGAQTQVEIPVLKTAPVLPAPAFDAPDPSMVTEAAAGEKSDCRVSRNGTTTVEGSSETSYVTSRGDRVLIRHVYTAAADAHDSASTSLDTQTSIEVVQDHRRVLAEATTHNLLSTRRAHVRVLIDDQSAFDRTFEA